MLSNSGVNINDSIQVKNHLNIYYNAQFSYFAYQQVISNCATFAGSYVLPRKGTEADFVESAYRFGFTGIEKDDEISGAGNHYTTEFREFDSRIVTWWSVDPLFRNFPSYSPYNYTEGNPILFTDRTGKSKESTIVDPNGNVVGGKLDGDKGVYKVAGVTKENFDVNKISEYKTSGVRIGTTASEYSFRHESGEWMGHINFGSKAAYNKINQALSLFAERNPDPYLSFAAFKEYSSQGGNWGDYDIKTWGLEEGATQREQTKNAYEASWGPQGLIFTNRDAGNYVAGRVAAIIGVPWSIAHSGFGAFNGAGNQHGGIYKRTAENFLTYPFRIGKGLKYKEYQGSSDLQAKGYFNR